MRDSKENYKWYMKVKRLRYTYYVSAPSEPKNKVMPIFI